MVKILQDDIKEIDISEDIVVVVAGIGIWLLDIFFTKVSKEWMQLLQDLINFEEYGQPTHFLQSVKLGNPVSTISQLYVLFGSIIYYAAGYSQRLTCNIIKKERNLDLLICDTFYPIWLPFHIHKCILILLHISIYSLTMITILSGVITSVFTWEVSEVLGTHIDYLNDNFKNSIVSENRLVLQRQLSRWIKYHNHVYNLINKFSKLVKQSVGHAVYMSAAVCGCGLSIAVGTKAISGMTFCFGWMFSILFLCTAGQTVIDKCLKTADAVYDSEWYKTDNRTRRDILFILLRSQKPNYLETFPFGSLNYSLYILIVQASYSYCTLLRNSVK